MPLRVLEFSSPCWPPTHDPHIRTHAPCMQVPGLQRPTEKEADILEGEHSEHLAGVWSKGCSRKASKSPSSPPHRGCPHGKRIPLPPSSPSVAVHIYRAAGRGRGTGLSDSRASWPGKWPLTRPYTPMLLASPGAPGGPSRPRKGGWREPPGPPGGQALCLSSETGEHLSFCCAASSQSHSLCPAISHSIILILHQFWAGPCLGSWGYTGE